MKVHKNIVIRVLLTHPEDLALLAPAWKGTVEELIDELKRRPGQYFVGGELEEDCPLENESASCLS
jgi:hypothetical protein